MVCLVRIEQDEVCCGQVIQKALDAELQNRDPELEKVCRQVIQPDLPEMDRPRSELWQVPRVVSCKRSPSSAHWIVPMDRQFRWW